MAELFSDTGALRFRLEMLSGETAGAAPDGRAPPGRLLARASLDYLDRRDGERWPFVELAALWLDGEAARALSGGLSALVQGRQPGFTWRSGDPAALGLQAGAPAATPQGLYLVEVGMDLSEFLSGAAGTAPRSGVELALFRFPVSRAALVAFASAVQEEVEGLLRT